MTINLDHELKRLGTTWLAEVEPITTEAMMRRAGTAIPIGGVRPVAPRSAAVPRSRRRIATTASIAAVALLVAALGVALREIGDDERPSQQNVAPSAGDLEWPPRLLIDGQWVLDSINETAHAEIEHGEVTYQTNGGMIRMTYSKDVHEDLPPMTREVAQAELLGVSVSVQGQPSQNPEPSLPGPVEDGFQVVVDIDGARFWLVSTGITLPEFTDALAGVHAVSNASFIEALPIEAVAPASRDYWLDAVLYETPVPDGFDRASLGNPDAILMLTGIHGLAARAAIEVTCAWTDQWFDATEDGDSARLTEAVDALGSIRSWALFANLDSYVLNDFARVTEALVAGEDYLDQPLDRDRVDNLLGCTEGQIASG